MKRVLALVVVVFVASGLLPAASAGPGDPILRPDTAFEPTSWGYKLKSLTFPPGEHPVVLYMEGYAGAGVPQAYLRMDDGELMALSFRFEQGPRRDYVRVLASIRGTNCSGGQFNLYDRRHAWDGHHIIEWIAGQPWSNRRVGMHGSSYPGQTAYFTATTQPPHLYAVSANLLHSDIYRDIFMVGGVQNYLFPSIWTYATGPDRLPTEALSRGALPGDEICLQNQASRYSGGEPLQPQQEPLWAAIGSTDNDWYAAHAAITYAPSIKIPYYQQANWQDEQTGPRAVVLYHHINPTPRTIVGRDGQARTVVPKKFVTSSGDHGWGQFHNRDLYAFMDIWLLDMPDRTGIFEQPFETYFETRADPPNSPYTAMKAGTWPFADTTWTKAYLHENGRVDFAAPEGEEATETYLSGLTRHRNWFWYAPDAGADVTTSRRLPDVVSYQSAPLETDMVIAGPIMMNLWASMAGTDTDFFVSLSDVDDRGNTSYLQRGWLKASHRRVDPQRSYYAADGTLVQPYRPHTNPQPIVPGEITDYLIEIFPLGHIFRTGHSLLVQVSTPPAVDGLWGYTPTHHQPAAVTLHHDRDHQSWVQLPVVPVDGPLYPAPEGCQVPGGFPCTPPSTL